MKKSKAPITFVICVVLLVFAAVLVVGSRLVSGDTGEQQYDEMKASVRAEYDIMYPDGQSITIDPNDPNRIELTATEPHEPYMPEVIDASGEGSPDAMDDMSMYYTIECPMPTHVCPVHGDLGAGSWSADILNISITIDPNNKVSYDACAQCAYLYLIDVLKKNIPQIAKH